MQTIFSKLLYEMEKQHDTVLATIIRESGSTPRGAGAQMLVNAQGPQAGTIGGGEVESAAPLTQVRNEVKIGRNEPCTCGSGKKYKHCCGRIS